MIPIVTLNPPLFSKRKGRALVSYLIDSVQPNLKHDLLRGHSNRWESREIARTFTKIGYITDVINWDDHTFKPELHYDVIFDISSRFSDWKSIIPKDTVKLLHLTGSYPTYQNDSEKLEAKAFEDRTHVKYILKRQVPNLEESLKSIELSDHCSLLGNQHTLDTYPMYLQKKISLSPVSASYLEFTKQKDYLPNRKNYLWYFGSGAIHKGLDKVVEVFLAKPEIQLNIVGNIVDDQPFWDAYGDKIATSKNIFYHGFLSPSDKQFIDLVKKTFCFIAPSCSESMSTSVTTCLQLGLYPIISRNTGVTLPNDCGIYLKNTSLDAISEGINTISGYSNGRIGKEIRIIQKDALRAYSRKNFSYNILNYLKKVLA